MARLCSRFEIPIGLSCKIKRCRRYFTGVHLLVATHLLPSNIALAQNHWKFYFETRCSLPGLGIALLLSNDSRFRSVAMHEASPVFFPLTVHILLIAYIENKSFLYIWSFRKIFLITEYQHLIFCRYVKNSYSLITPPTLKIASQNFSVAKSSPPLKLS